MSQPRPHGRPDPATDTYYSDTDPSERGGTSGDPDPDPWPEEQQDQAARRSSERRHDSADILVQQPLYRSAPSRYSSDSYSSQQQVSSRYPADGYPTHQQAPSRNSSNNYPAHYQQSVNYSYATESSHPSTTLADHGATQTSSRTSSYAYGHTSASNNHPTNGHNATDEQSSGSGKAATNMWIWSEPHQDHYYVSYDAQGLPVYHWAKDRRP